MNLPNPVPAEITVGPDGVLDGRTIPCAIKHALVLKTCMDLPVGGHFILVNDHDPARMHHQLVAQWPGAFAWQYLIQGPDEFQIKISKLSPLGEPAVPEATPCTPTMARIRVVFPLPLGPAMARNSPATTRRLASVRALTKLCAG